MANSQGPGPGTQLIAHAIAGWACATAIAKIAGKPLTAAAKLLAFLAGVVVRHWADAPVAALSGGTERIVGENDPPRRAPLYRPLSGYRSQVTGLNTP